MRGEGVIPSPRRRVSAVPPPAAIARSENRPGSAVSMLRAPVRKTAAACAAVCFLLLAASASAVNVTVAYTVAVRGRLFQFGAFGGDCKQELYSCCDLVPGCKGGMARVAHVVRELRSSRPPGSVIMLDGGQQVGETSAWQTFRGSMMRKMMLQINYTAKGVASNELYIGPNNLADFVSGQQQFSLVSSNLDVDTQHQLAPLVKRHIVTDANGILVGITGISSESICDSTSCAVNGQKVVSVSPARQALTSSVGFLLNRGADIIVVITAGSGLSARDIARRISKVNVIIVSPDEWANEPTDEFPVVEVGPLGEEVIILSSQQYGESMGYIDISLDDKTHHVVSWEASLVELDESVPFDNATAEILRKAEELSLEERVVGTALGTFGCPETEFALLIGVSTCSRFGESEIGNLVADAILQYARGLGASVALMNGGGIRSIIGQGNITDKQARAVVPFPNTISVIRVTGKTLGAALNNSLSRIDSENGTGRLLQVSGVRMKFDMARDPEERVFDVETLTPDGWWSPLHEDSVYTVALPDFVRNGGDGYNMFANDALEAIDYGPTLITILVKYIEDRHPTPGVRPVLHGRLVNATVGAAPGVYGCVTSRVVVNASGLVGDGCDGIRKRSYTHAVLKIEPSQQDHVAVLLRLRVDSRWLLPFNASEIHPDGSHDVRMEIVTGDKARDNSGFNYDTSGFNVLSSIAKDRTSLTSGEILEHVMVVSAAAVQIELESSRPMDGWQEVTVEYAVLSTCPPGYTFEVQGTRQGCSPCPAGLFSNASGGECVPCAEGTANHLTGQSQCTLCQEGYYQPFSGQMRCEMCLGTVRAHATACEMPEGFPLYGYILLAILGIGAGILMILAAKFALSRKPRAMDHQIKFEDLEFDVPPHVLGSGSLGLVVAATYRGFPVAVKQIKKGGGKRANRTDVNDGENSSRNCSLLDDPQETKSRLASIRDGIETEIEQSVLRMVGQNKISFDIQAAAVDYGTNDLRSGRASLAAGARETTRVVPTEELLEDPGSRNAGRAASLPGKDLETGPLIPAARGDKSDGHFAPSAPHEHRSISKTSQQPLRRLQSIWGSRVLVSGPRWSSWFSKVSEVESEHMKAIYAMRHPHVVAVMGVTRCPDNSVGLVIERLEQGSLYNLVHNPMIFFDNAAMFGITQNIVQGMTYMHLAQPPVIHRLLKASNVVVDSKFTAKVSDFGLADLIGDADIVSSSAAALWMAPEVLCGEACTTASDVYSFGITLYELWTRCDPYAGEEVNAVVRDVARPPPSAMRVIWKRPVLPEGHQVPQRVISLMEDCWHQDPARRPSFQAIAGTLRNIEEEVIKQNQRQFGQDRQLLEQILPPHVAELLREGKEVPPEKHDMVTLLFTDIVGFTDISSTLKPEQVMNMLDRLYTAFDALAAEYDLFKVETIGDAYMAVSNLHKRQWDHTRRMCGFALDAIKAARKIEIVPGGGIRPDGNEWGTISIRAGIHCGAVVASVAGKLNPRYCLFGDTVNTASRMESNSVANRVHLSLAAAGMLRRQSKAAKLERRGKVDIKGKGLMTTYWLLDCPPPSQDETEDGGSGRAMSPSSHSLVLRDLEGEDHEQTAHGTQHSISMNNLPGFVG